MSSTTSVRVAVLFGKDGAAPEMPRRFVGQNDAPGRGSAHKLHPGVRKLLRHRLAQRLCPVRKLKDTGRLEKLRAMPSARVNEMAVQEGTALLEMGNSVC